MANKNIIRALKLLEHVERNTGPEQANAKALLEAHLKRCGLKLEDIKPADHTFYFQVPKELQRLFLQVAYSVLGIDKVKVGNGKLKLHCNYIAYIDIKNRYEFYKDHYTKELALFNDAFFNKNGLFPDSSAPIEPEQVNELTEEELYRIQRMQQLMQLIEYKPYQKALTA